MNRERDMRRLAGFAAFAVLCLPVSSHDDTYGARYVDGEGADVSECLEHHDPCREIAYALSMARPGNTIKVAAGVYDVTGISPESFLFGAIQAKGGYEPGGHFDRQNAEANLTILVGVDADYRQAVMRQGFRWAADAESARLGIVDDSPPPALQATAVAPADCLQGFAGQFPCQNLDLLAQISLNQFAGQPLSASNLWGFVDQNDGREYVVIGLRNGTAVVEATDPRNPRQVVVIPGNSSTWREVKIYQHFDEPGGRFRTYAYVTTEAPDSGLQVIDLGGLPATATLATTLADTGSQHTAYVSNIDFATNMALAGAEAFLYLAGSDVGQGEWRAYSLANPAAPQFIASAPAGSQYVHDATSLLISDARAAQCAPGHDPCEVYVDFNESTVDLWDVTDKAAPLLLSSTTYSDASYTHSGWPSADQRYVFVHDETEEITRGLFTQIYAMNVEDLRNPYIVVNYQGPDTTTDHNGYTRGDLLYVSHYRRGLVVFDAADPEALREIGHFDTFLAPAANVAGFDGAWGVYPFLPSGTIAVSDISNGLFLLRDQAATIDQFPGTVGFVGASLSVGENADFARITVRRNNGRAGEVSVDYSTADGTAIAGTDYEATSGTIHWPAGELDEREIAVRLIGDNSDEGMVSFRITLSNPAGGAAIEGEASLDVEIVKDDATAQPPPAGGGGGGGGASGVELLLLCAPLLAAASRKKQPRRSADDRADQVRLRHDGGAEPFAHRKA